MIQTLTDILAQIPDEEKEGLEASVRDLVLTDDSLVEVKMGGGAFQEEGIFLWSIFMAIRNTEAKPEGHTTLQQLVDNVTLDVHKNGDQLAKKFVEFANPPYRMTFVELGKVAPNTWALHFSIHASLKPATV